MKFNPIYAVGGVFVTGVVVAGAWLLQATNADQARPSPTADPELLTSASPPAPPAPPKDENFVIKRVLPINGPIKYGEWHWDDKDVPDGPLVITVDLDARVLSIFKGGYEIGASAVLLGTTEKPTPTGIFPIKWKKKDHYSSIYDGAPMPYTMNLTEDGIAIHGTKVEKGYASHGCIGLPDPFVAKIFAIAPVGTKVYITRGKMVKQGDSLI